MSEFPTRCFGCHQSAEWCTLPTECKRCHQYYCQDCVRSKRYHQCLTDSSNTYENKEDDYYHEFYQEESSCIIC